MPFARRGTGALPRSRVESEPEQNPDGIHLADHPAVQHSVYLAAFWPQKGQSAIEMVGGVLPGWMAARDDGTVAVSSDLEVVGQTLCADIDAERFATEVYPRYVLASLSSAATPSTAPLPQHPTTYIICEQDQASPPQAQEAMSSAADHVIRLPPSHSPFRSTPGPRRGSTARIKARHRGLPAFTIVGRPGCWTGPAPTTGHWGQRSSRSGHHDPVPERPQAGAWK